MKRSYVLCSVLMVVIVLFMIVVGVVQDNRMKKARVIECVNKTMAVAGCREIAENESSVESRTSSNSSTHYKSVFASDEVEEDENADDNSADVKLKVKDASYQIKDTKVDGDQAEVTICIFHEEHTCEMTLVYMLVDDEWTLDNSKDFVRKIVIDGKECDMEDFDSLEKMFG